MRGSLECLPGFSSGDSESGAWGPLKCLENHRVDAVVARTVAWLGRESCWLAPWVPSLGAGRGAVGRAPVHGGRKERAGVGGVVSFFFWGCVD